MVALIFFLPFFFNLGTTSDQMMNAEELNRKPNMHFTFCFPGVQIP